MAEKFSSELDRIGNTPLVKISSAKGSAAIWGKLESANPGGSTISGTNPVSAAAGVATFSDISLDKVGTNYTFDAASGVLTTATSNT